MKKSDSYRLYGITHSLYTGRARSYLIKSGVPFREFSSGHESFKAEVLPESKLATIPVLVTPEGAVIRDGAAIIEHFERANGREFEPPSAKQKIISTLFELIGTSGLLRPAMHYRWNYLDENREFLHYHFIHSQPEHPERGGKGPVYDVENAECWDAVWGYGTDHAGGGNPLSRVSRSPQSASYRTALSAGMEAEHW
ncbi:glutathione S-transferase domain-containing protein [Porticoccaceae bacterium]|nr:glutathione S-transferase domain-containing protein [Porticoccaceae bacterium]